MITELGVTNFKSWANIPKMRLSPITGIFGANSSGKTSILQLLLMLKQTVESSDRAQVLVFGDDRSGYANLGSFKEVIHRHDSSQSLSWYLRWALLEKLLIDNPFEAESPPLFASDDMAFKANVTGNGDRPKIVEMLYKLGDTSFTMHRRGTNGDEYDLSCDSDHFKFIRTPGRVWPLPAPIKCYGFPDQTRAYFQNTVFLADLQLAFEKMFGRVFYLGPLRDYPRRQYSWGGARPADMGQRGEHVVDAILAAGDRGEKISMGKGKRRRSLEEHVAWWLKELGLVHSFLVEAVDKERRNFRVKVKRSQNSPDVWITDVGFGVSQILPVLVLCFYVPDGSTIILEQPEIHLHPSVQAGLADVFIDAVKRRNVQIIFESHSEHLLRRLQRRIAEKKISQNEAALYFCKTGAEHSILTSLDMNMYGNITNWPEDFFGDEFGELAATMEAAMKRKRDETA